MKYTYITQNVSEERSMVSTFYGIDQNDVIPEGAFCEAENLTSDYYPVLAPRNSHYMRYEGPVGVRITGIIENDGIWYTCGTKIYHGTTGYEMGLSTGGDHTEKKLLNMGAYILIWPDKKYINTKDTEDKGSIEADNVIPADQGYYAVIKNCDENGDDISVYASSTAPTITPDTLYWLDTSSEPYQMKKYDSNLEYWSAVNQSYVKISYQNDVTGYRLTTGLSEGDYVILPGLSISELADYETNYTEILKIIHTTTDDVIVIRGNYAGSGGSDPSVHKKGFRVKRPVPDMDHIIESENRIWGCKYGLVNGKQVNEIYASALGDFKNWYKFEGISTDSYAVSVGSDGAFTGAVNYRGYPMFFKKDCLHKIYGSYPAQYQTETTTIPGVDELASESLAVINGILYYRSTYGVYAYSGSQPECISDALDIQMNSGGYGAACGDKYYISMKYKRGSTVTKLFSYDTKRGIWHMESVTGVRYITGGTDELCYVTEGTATTADKIYTVQPDYQRYASEESVSWSAVTGIIGLDDPDNKYISKAVLRLWMAAGSSMTVSIEYDSSGEYEILTRLEGSGLQSFSMPIRLRRCDHFRLKLEGSGFFRLFSITKTVEKGGMN